MVPPHRRQATVRTMASTAVLKPLVPRTLTGRATSRTPRGCNLLHPRQQLRLLRLEFSLRERAAVAKGGELFDLLGNRGGLGLDLCRSALVMRDEGRLDRRPRVPRTPCPARSETRQSSSPSQRRSSVYERSLAWGGFGNLGRCAASRGLVLSSEVRPPGRQIQPSLGRLSRR